MTQSDSEDESRTVRRATTTTTMTATETLADMLERTRREQAAQREVEAEGTAPTSRKRVPCFLLLLSLPLKTDS